MSTRKERSGKYNWELIRAWYIEEKVRNAGITLMDVTRQFGCSEDTLYKKAKAENWDQLIRDRTTSYLAKVEYERTQRDQHMWEHILDNEASYRRYMTEKSLDIYRKLTDKLDTILLRVAGVINMTENDRRDIKILGDLIVKISADSQAKVGLPSNRDEPLKAHPVKSEIRSRDELKHRELESIVNQLSGILGLEFLQQNVKSDNKNEQALLPKEHVEQAE